MTVVHGQGNSAVSLVFDQGFRPLAPVQPPSLYVIVAAAYEMCVVNADAIAPT
jgi:hypothetical protein